MNTNGPTLEEDLHLLTRRVHGLRIKALAEVQNVSRQCARQKIYGALRRVSEAARRCEAAERDAALANTEKTQLERTLAALTAGNVLRLEPTIDVLEISPRVHHVLTKAGLLKLTDVVQAGERGLSELPGLRGPQVAQIMRELVKLKLVPRPGKRVPPSPPATPVPEP